jgi:hypothetical protein
VEGRIQESEGQHQQHHQAKEMLVGMVLHQLLMKVLAAVEERGQQAQMEQVLRVEMVALVQPHLYLDRL